MKSADIRKLWQMEGLDATPPTPEAMAERASAFARQIRRRNLIEYAASALVVGGFSYYAWVEDNPIVRIGHLFIVAAAIYIAWQLRSRASPGEAPVAPTTAEAIAHLRREFARQRDALAHVLEWYLLPFAPGFALSMAGRMVLPDAGAERPAVLSVLVPVTIVVLLFYGIWRLNRAAADKLQSSIDELDRIGKELE